MGSPVAKSYVRPYGKPYQMSSSKSADLRQTRALVRGAVQRGHRALSYGADDLATAPTRGSAVQPGRHAIVSRIPRILKKPYSTAIAASSRGLPRGFALRLGSVSSGVIPCTSWLHRTTALH
jgi:hypothetical protein